MDPADVAAAAEARAMLVIEQRARVEVAETHTEESSSPIKIMAGWDCPEDVNVNGSPHYRMVCTAFPGETKRELTHRVASGGADHLRRSHAGY